MTVNKLKELVYRTYGSNSRIYKESSKVVEDERIINEKKIKDAILEIQSNMETLSEKELVEFNTIIKLIQG